jgi:hypothetical protein
VEPPPPLEQPAEGVLPYSYAPMSYAPPAGRPLPSKSQGTSESEVPASFAGLPEVRWKSPEEGLTKLGSEVRLLEVTGVRRYRFHLWLSRY